MIVIDIIERSTRARVAVEKDLLAGEPLPIPAAATDPKEAEIDKSAVPEEFEVNVDARRSAEFRSLPEEVRVRIYGC